MSRGLHGKRCIVSRAVAAAVILPKNKYRKFQKAELILTEAIVNFLPKLITVIALLIPSLSIYADAYI